MAIIIVVVLLIVVFALALYYVYNVAFQSPKKGQNNVYDIPKSDQYDPHKEEMLELIDRIVSRPYEDVYLTSFDGLGLHARYYHIKDKAPLDIAVHGYRATALRDFCVGGNATFDRGHNLLLIDQRAQGESEGHTITMGVKEHKDVLSWVQWANARFSEDTKIILYGVSMGAASVIMATSLPLPKNVMGVIADSPYSSPKDIVLDVAQKDMSIPPKLAYHFVYMAAKILGGFDINSITCKDAVKKAKIPVLIIHGESDRYVPCYMSEEIERANPEMVTRYTFKNAGHGISYFSDKERYKELTEAFFEKYS